MLKIPEFWPVPTQVPWEMSTCLSYEVAKHVLPVATLASGVPRNPGTRSCRSQAGQPPTHLLHARGSGHAAERSRSGRHWRAAPRSNVPGHGSLLRKTLCSWGLLCSTTSWTAEKEHSCSSREIPCNPSRLTDLTENDRKVTESNTDYGQQQAHSYAFPDKYHELCLPF